MQGCIRYDIHADMISSRHCVACRLHPLENLAFSRHRIFLFFFLSVGDDVIKARVGFPMDRLSPSAVRQLSPECFHFPASLECVEVLYEKLFVQASEKQLRPAKD